MPTYGRPLESHQQEPYVLTLLPPNTNPHSRSAMYILPDPQRHNPRPQHPRHNLHHDAPRPLHPHTAPRPARRPPPSRHPRPRLRHTLTDNNSHVVEHKSIRLNTTPLPRLVDIRVHRLRDLRQPALPHLPRCRDRAIPAHQELFAEPKGVEYLGVESVAAQ